MLGSAAPPADPSGFEGVLRPDPELNRIVTFYLAHYAAKLGILVHAVSVRSTHMHLVLSAEEQRISGFMEYANAQLAKEIKRLRRLGQGPVWEVGELHIEELRTEDAIVNAMAYAICNPVAAGLVWRPEEWPGVCTQVGEIGGGELRAARPVGYADPKSDAGWPEIARVAITMPPSLAHLGVAEVQRRVRASLDAHLAAAHADIKRSWKRGVLGRTAVLAQSPYRRAKTFEHFGKIDPHFAVGAGNHEERREAIAELRQFRADYGAAWLAYRAGQRDVVFPYGTMKLRRLHGVRVASDPRGPPPLRAAA